MDKSKVLFNEIFFPIPEFKSLPKTEYKQKWKYNDSTFSDKLFLTVVENPTIRIMKSDSRVKRYSDTKLISSDQYIPVNIVKLTQHLKLTLDFFRAEPFTPFIPDIILFGVNRLENYCHEHDDWSVYYTCKNKANRNLCNGILEFSYLNPTCSDTIKEMIANSTVDDVGFCILGFLTIFEKKNLHIAKNDLLEILSKPLYDKFLRPNPCLRNIVKASILKSSRTTSDTLSFLMLHILHIWEYSNMPYATKIKLSKLFGPRLISFEETVYLFDTENATSPQSALLEAILEICDSEFWLMINFNERNEVFSKETNFERKKRLKSVPRRERPIEFPFLCNPYSLFPSLIIDGKDMRIEQYKTTNFYKKVIKFFQGDCN